MNILTNLFYEHGHIHKIQLQAAAKDSDFIKSNAYFELFIIWKREHRIYNLHYIKKGLIGQ